MPNIQNKVTLSEAMRLYLNMRKLKVKTGRDYRSRINRALIDWLDMPVSKITSKMVQQRHAEIKAKTPRQADLVFTILGAILKFANGLATLENDLARANNPVDILIDLKQRTKTQSRIDDYIRDHELGRWFIAVKRQQNSVASDYFIFLLMTGMRRTVTSELTWENIDFENGIVQLPREKTKNSKPFKAPLCTYLLELLKERKKYSNSPYVFPSKFSAAGHISHADKVQRQIIKESGVRFSPHCLKATFANIMSHPEVMADELSIKTLLSHSSSEVTWRHYLTTHTERLRPTIEGVSKYILKKADEESKKLGLALEAQRPLMLRVLSPELVASSLPRNARTKISAVDQVLVEAKILLCVKAGYHRKKDFYKKIGAGFHVNKFEMNRILCEMEGRGLLEAYKPVNGDTSWQWRFRDIAIMMLEDKSMTKTEDCIIDVEAEIAL